MPPGQIADAVASIQRANQWTDAEVAEMIGIDRRQWNMARRGRRRLGPISLRGIARAFPQLKDAVERSFFGEGSTEVARVERAGKVA